MRNHTLNSLTLAWLALILLTLASVALGKGYTDAGWLPALMAVTIWAKSAIVANRFIEADRAHPFVRWLVRLFIALTPITLILLTLAA